MPVSDENPYVVGPSVEDRDYLAELYHDEGLSVAEIADEIGRNKNTVYRWFRKYDVYGYDGGDA